MEFNSGFKGLLMVQNSIYLCSIVHHLHIMHFKIQLTPSDSVPDTA